jgi:predicted metal-dependent hydrolase
MFECYPVCLEVYALNESIAVRRKQLEMKQSSQSASKTDYYRKEIDRDRTARETKEQNLKEELETKLERLKREYDANVKDITDKLERKAERIKEDSDTYQRYCKTNMNQEVK